MLTSMKSMATFLHVLTWVLVVATYSMLFLPQGNDMPYYQMHAMLCYGMYAMWYYETYVMWYYEIYVMWYYEMHAILCDGIYTM